MKLLNLSIFLLAFCLAPINLAPVDEALEEEFETNDVASIDEPIPVDLPEDDQPAPPPKPFGKKDKKNKKNKDKKDKGKVEFCEPIEFVGQLQRYYNRSSMLINYTQPVWTKKDFLKCGFNVTLFDLTRANKTRMNDVATKLVKLGLVSYVIANFSAQANQTLDVDIDKVLDDLPFIFVIGTLMEEGILPPRQVHGRRFSGFSENGGNGGRGKGGKGEDGRNKKNNNQNDNNVSSSEEHKSGKKNRRNSNQQNNHNKNNANNDDRVQLLLLLGSASESLGDFGKQDINGHNNRDDNNNQHRQNINSNRSENFSLSNESDI